MKFKNKNLIVLFVVISFLLSSYLLYAEDVRFQNTSEEMVKELSRSSLKYKSVVLKNRGIKVIQQTNNKIEEKVVMIDESIKVPKLKLKIEFDYNSSSLKKTSYILLKEIGKALLSDELKNQNFMITGHTDSDGSEQYNQKLSFERADSVKAYLVINFDIPENKLQIRGAGELLPLKPNTTPNNKQTNRRVEVELTN